MRRAWLAAAALAWGGPAAAQVVSVRLQPPPRDFGVFVGDSLTSTAIIEILPGTTLDPRSLPPEGPASPGIDVRQVRVERGTDRIAIRVTYQSFVSPEQVSSAEVPSYTVAFASGQGRLKTVVPGFRFTASTFRHDLQPTLDPASLRPDHVPAPARATGAGLELAMGLLAMAGGLLALAWPLAFAPRRGPFRAASRQLAGLARRPTADAGCAAMLALHRAFDATAGRRIFADDLGDFVIRHPQFRPCRDRAAAFFAASRTAFFGGPAEAPAIGAWLALARDLARAERLG